MASERTFRRAIAYWGYRLRRHGETYALIDKRNDSLLADDLTLEQTADYIAELISPKDRR